LTAPDARAGAAPTLPAGRQGVEPPAVAAVLPERTLALAVAENLARTAEDFRQTSLYKLWMEPEVQQFLGAFLGKLREKIGQQLDPEASAVVADVLAAFRGQIAAAFVGFQERDGVFLPEIVLMAEVTDRAAAVRLIDRGKAMLEANGVAGVRVWDLGPVSLGMVVPADRTGPMQGGYILTGSTLFLAVGPGGNILSEIASAATGGAAGKSLAGDAEFLAAVARAGGRRDVFAYLAADATVQKAFEIIAARKVPNRQQVDLARRVWSALGLDGIRSVSLSEAIDPPGWRTQVFVHAPEPRRGLLRLVSGPPVSDSLLRLAPADARCLVAWRYDTANLLETARDLVRAVDPAQETLMNTSLASMAAMGIDVDGQVLKGLGMEGMFFAPQGQLPGPMALLPGFTLVLKASDPGKVASLYQSVTGLAAIAGGGMGVQFKEYPSKGGARIVYVEVPMQLTPAITMYKGYIVIAATKDAVESVCRALDRPLEKPLVASADYQKTLARASSGQATAPGFLVAYLDALRPQDIETIMGLVPIASQAARMELSRPRHREVQDLLTSINLLEMPSPKTLTRHGMPCIKVGWADKDGVGVTHYGPVGLSTVPAALATAAAGAASSGQAFGKARARARQTAAASYLRQTGLGCHLYAMNNNEAFPKRLADLVPEYIGDAKVIESPATGLPFVYVSGLKATDQSEQILAYENPSGGRGMVSVLFVDGSVQQRPAAFVERLAQQQVQRLNAAGRRDVKIVESKGAPPPADVEEYF